MPNIQTFKRIEKKYRLSRAQYEALLPRLQEGMIRDQYGLHTINNIYFDTESFACVRRSIAKPVYKEKLRLRAYGTPGSEDTVFVELKKKYKGIVYKRRAPLANREAMQYLLKAIPPKESSQVLREIDWYLQKNPVVPKVCLAYDRLALAGREDASLRVTFDEGIRWRTDALNLTQGSYGTPLLPGDGIIMEVKLQDAMPLWLAALFSALNIYPSSFSKYGACYQQFLMHGDPFEGGLSHVS